MFKLDHYIYNGFAMNLQWIYNEYSMQPPNGSDKKPLSQREVLEEALLAIKKDVTQLDRLVCAEKVNRSKRTIDGYVNGHVYDVGVALSVLTCLKMLIEERLKEINKK